jgi:hypothetical protein
METLIVRFLTKIDMPENFHDCWLWTGASVAGYGQFKVGDKILKAHRVSYELFNQAHIPTGEQMRHLCHTRMCVNPEHLAPGTPSDNTQDKLAAGRHRHVNADSAVRSAQMKKSWASYTPEQRAARVKNMSTALAGKSFTPSHLENLRAAHAKWRGKPARYVKPCLVTEEQLVEIERRYVQGETAAVLAKDYGVSPGAVTKWMRSRNVVRQFGRGTASGWSAESRLKMSRSRTGKRLKPSKKKRGKNQLELL